MFTSIQGIPTNILSARLERLGKHGMIVRTETPGGGKHLAYRLTSKGDALKLVIAAITAWPTQE